MAGGVREHPERITDYVVAAAAGFILGYHLGLTSGVASWNCEMELNKYFPATYQRVACGEVESTTLLLPLFTSSAFLAALYCCPLASYATRACGHKPVLTIGAAYFLVGSILCSDPQEFRHDVVGHILLCVGVALLNQSAPLYFSEMPPCALNMMFQLAMAVGYIAANLVTFNFVNPRRSLYGAAVPGLIVFVGALFLPKYTSNLNERCRPEEAKETLHKIRGTSDVAQNFSHLVAASEASNQITSPWVKLRPSQNHRPQLVLAIAILLFQSLTGITRLMFSAPWVYRNSSSMITALLNRDLLLPALIISVVNVVVIFVGAYVVDSMHRRTLLVFSPRQMRIFLIAIGAMMWYGHGFRGVVNLSIVYGAVKVACICSYVAGYISSLIPLGGLFPSEVFSPEVLLAAQSVKAAPIMICTHVTGQCVWILLSFYLAVLIHKSRDFIAAATILLAILLAKLVLDRVFRFIKSFIEEKKLRLKLFIKKKLLCIEDAIVRFFEGVSPGIFGRNGWIPAEKFRVTDMER